METTIIISGFGGQGVQTCGHLLAYGANEEDKQFTFYSQYGGAMRGGTSNCTVKVSDEEIGSPSQEYPEFIAALNIPSFKRFESKVAPGGTLIVNKSIVPNSLYSRQDITYAEIDANGIAEKIGNMKVLNIAVLGFICEYTKMVDPEIMKKVVLERMAKKPQFLAMNEQAFEEGRAAAKALC